MIRSHVCIHGHFYQPPRENPWTGVIDDEPGASPFANWNERIAAECYAPNAQAALLDDEGDVAERQNNYAWISFNFGPTLLNWMARRQPSLLDGLRAADEASRARVGSGNAMAQAYHHSILPLASARDRETEVAWGIAAFEHYFGRKPDGMWLPEAAVDTPTLEALAAAGVRFVLLAPRQATAVRAPDGDWQGVGTEGVPCHRAYRVRLPSGRELAAFFYHGPLSQAVAFERVLDNGDAFAQRIANVARGLTRTGALTHLATDGESYGHHHRFGEMALAFALRRLRETPGVTLTNYAAYLAEHPARWEVRIREPSSWSCAHGVERWRSNCGCAADGARTGRHGWRAPLRAALDEVRDEVASYFREDAARLVDDPWAVRNGWKAACYDARETSYLQGVVREPDPERVERMRKHLELQEQALAMYASCGWFFDDPAGIEPVNNLRRADRVLRAHEALSGRSARPRFLAALEGFATESVFGSTAALLRTLVCRSPSNPEV